VERGKGFAGAGSRPAPRLSFVKIQLAGNDQLLRWASLLARPGDKVVTRVDIATIKVFQLADATTPVLTLGAVDPVP
jgi:hypothetical protein